MIFNLTFTKVYADETPEQDNTVSETDINIIINEEFSSLPLNRLSKTAEY